MHKQLGTIITVFILCLFCSTSIFAETSTSSSSTTSSSTNVPSGEAITSNSNSTTETTVTNSTTTTTVDDGDSRIVGQVYKAYATRSTLNGTTLSVTCKNGVVYISGDVTTTSQAEEAVIAAKSVVGVKDVRSTINVSTNQTKSVQPSTPNY